MDMYEKAIQYDPQLPEAYNNLGKALSDGGDEVSAMAMYRQALTHRPEYRQARLNAAIHLHRMGEYQNAVDEYSVLFENLGDDEERRLDYEAHYNLAVSLQELGLVMKAVDHYRLAIAGEQNYAEAWLNLASLHHQHGTVDDAVWHYERVLEVIDFRHYEQGTLERGVYTGLWIMTANNLALALVQKGRVLDGIDRHRAALRMVEAEAREDTDTWLHSRAHIFRARKAICAWQDWEGGLQALLRDVDAVQVSRGISGAILPFDTLGIPMSPGWRLRVARLHSDQWSGLVHDFPPRATPPPSSRRTGTGDNRRRLRIGYLCYDFNDHPTAHLVEGLFKWHARDEARSRAQLPPDSRVALPEAPEVAAYNYGKDDDSSYRRNIVGLVEDFVDLAEMGHLEAAQRIKSDDVHIIVDMQGHTLGGRPAISAYRPAPILVNYLIYPGTWGASYVDYLIADAVVTPPEHALYYHEKLVLMPHCYQVNYYDRHVASDWSLASSAPSASPSSRATHGLPETAFVFCNFNKNDKLEPRIFAVWMAVLRQVPGSVLWLLEPSLRTDPQMSSAIKSNLAAAAEAMGVDPKRLVYASRVGKAEHLARHEFADLFLDTFLYGAHSTATDALRGGLPVLTCAGGTFPQRVGASLLRSIDSGDFGEAGGGRQSLFVTADMREFEALAVALASTAGGARGLAGLRARLQSRGAVASPLFNTALYTGDMERSFHMMWEVYSALATPANLVVGSGDRFKPPAATAPP